MDGLLTPYRLGILLLLISFGAVSAVILTPALPELSRVFHISDAKAQLTMSVYLVGYSLGQLPYGPIANRFGRKKAIYLGISLMFIGSLMALVSSNFWSLVGARFIQALGAAVGLKITFTMISDQHEGKEAIRAISLLSLAFALMPPLGITIGGYLVQSWSWRGCFGFSCFYAILLGTLSLLLPETSKRPDLTALQLPKMISGYLRQFKSSATVLNGLIMGLISSNYYVCATLFPYIGINYIGLTPKQFGLWNLTLCIGLFIGISFTRWFAKKEKPRLSMQIGLCIMGFGAFLLLVCFSFSFINVWTLFLIPTFTRIGVNAVWSNASSNGMSVSTDKSNTSAVMQFVNLSTSTVALFFISAFPPSHVMLLPLSLAIITLLLYLVWRRLGTIE